MFRIKIIVYHETIFECRRETNMVNVRPLQKVPSQICTPIFSINIHYSYKGNEYKVQKYISH